MPPKAFSLMPPSRGSTCTAVVLCPPSLSCVRLHSGPSCSVQLLCLGPRPPGRSRGVSAGTWAPGYWPRDPDQTPGRELLHAHPQEMPGAAASMWGTLWPVVALEREEACCLPSVDSLPCRVARPAGAFGESTCWFGQNVGETAHTRCCSGHFKALCPATTLGRGQTLFPAMVLICVLRKRPWAGSWWVGHGPQPCPSLSDTLHTLTHSSVLLPRWFLPPGKSNLTPATGLE